MSESTMTVELHAGLAWWFPVAKALLLSVAWLGFVPSEQLVERVVRRAVWVKVIPCR